MSLSLSIGEEGSLSHSSLCWIREIVKSGRLVHRGKTESAAIHLLVRYFILFFFFAFVFLVLIDASTKNEGVYTCAARAIPIDPYLRHLDLDVHLMALVCRLHPHCPTPFAILEDYTCIAATMHVRRTGETAEVLVDLD